MVEFWLITLVKFLWDIFHDHISYTQRVICEGSTGHFAMTVLSHFTLCMVGINYINFLIYRDVTRDKDMTITSLKKELKITKSQLEQETSKKD